MATDLLAPTPTEMVNPTSRLTRCLDNAGDVLRAVRSGVTDSVTSMYASSMESGSTSGVMSLKMSMTWRETSAYRPNRASTRIRSGHRWSAVRIGIADRTPYRRAS